MATKSLYQVNPMPRGALVAILLVSALAVAFLLWLLYVHQAPAEFSRMLNFLPSMNALFNAMSAMALCTGYYFIRKSNPQAHRNSMITAFCLSSLFLVSYIVNHALHGDTHYPGHGIVRGIYLSILASHIILSVVALPLVLITFFLSLTRRFPIHRKVARYTFPIWLYVSITGVVVFAMLRVAF